MRTHILIFKLLILLNITFASSSDELAIKLLPPPLEEIRVGTTSIEGVFKLIGKPDLVEGSTYYWIFHNFKYALQIKKQSGQVSSLHFTFPKKRPKASDYLKRKNFKPHQSDSRGRYQYMEYFDRKVKWIVDWQNDQIISLEILP